MLIGARIESRCDGENGMSRVLSYTVFVISYTVLFIGLQLLTLDLASGEVGRWLRTISPALAAPFAFADRATRGLALRTWLVGRHVHDGGRLLHTDLVQRNLVRLSQGPVLAARANGRLARHTRSRNAARCAARLALLRATQGRRAFAAGADDGQPRTLKGEC